MKFIPSILAFYIFAGSLLPSMDYSQFAHLPELQAHFYEHQAEAASYGESISVVSFIYLHFITPGQHHHDNHEGHTELPFQSMNPVLNICVSSISPFNIQLLLNIVPRALLSYISKLHLSGFLTIFLHPPSR